MALYHTCLAILNQVTSHPVTALGHLQYLHLYLCVSVHTVYTVSVCLHKTPLDTLDLDHTHHPPLDIDQVFGEGAAMNS